MTLGRRPVCGWVCVVVLAHAYSAMATDNSTGPNGINSLVTSLNGQWTFLGQVEPGRPGRPTFDNALNSHPNVMPVQVFEQNLPARANLQTADHAQEVAGVIISTHGTYKGVAPSALLRSASYTGPVVSGQIRAAAAASKIQQSGLVSALNMSFGMAPAGAINGSDFLSAFVDWSASRHRSLYVVAGDEVGVVLTVPSDNYNGVTVGMSRMAPGPGGLFQSVAYDRVDPDNVYTTASNGRRLVDLVAPGRYIATTNRGGVFTRDTFTDSNLDRSWFSNANWFENNLVPGFQGSENWIENGAAPAGYNHTFNAGDFFFDHNHDGARNGAANDDYFITQGDPRFAGITTEPIQDVDGNGIVDFRVSGTSFAAPHVTGSVGLLHQYALGTANDPEFFYNLALGHRVTKAMLMNSADKRKDMTPEGLLLGMEKTILRDGSTDTNDWIQQRAAEGAGRDSIPLDLQLGTGQLNVKRAVDQLSQGRRTPDAPVPVRAWDSNSVAPGAPKIYQIADTLVANSYIAITLTWDRTVTLNDTFNATNGGTTDQFDAETFIDTNSNGVWNAGEPLNDINGNGVFDAGTNDTFTIGALDDLDLYLQPRGDPDPANAVAKSISTLYSVEHIFFQIPAAGQYDIMVRKLGAGTVSTLYGLAWWAVPQLSKSTWNRDANAVWSNVAHWTEGVVPNSTTSIAHFGGNITAPRTVTNDAPHTVREIVFDSDISYTIAGGNALTLETPASTIWANVRVLRGNHTIQTPLFLQQTTEFNVGPANSELTLTQTPTVADTTTVSLRKSGSGTLELPRFAGRVLNVLAGTVRVTPNGTVLGTSKVKAISTQGFYVAGVGKSQGRIDLTNNAMVIDYVFPATPVGQVRDMLRDGYNGGAWNGAGMITSSGSATGFGIGYAEASALFNIPPIFGAVDNDSLLIRFTRFGDADLNGLVNLFDFNALAVNFGLGGVWWLGDFDYNGFVGLSDFNLLAANFGLMAGPDGPTPADWAALASAVPEPGTAGLIAASLGMCARRRRRYHAAHG